MLVFKALSPTHFHTHFLVPVLLTCITACHCYSGGCSSTYGSSAHGGFHSSDMGAGTYGQQTGTGGGGGGGFWSGAATGGILGYLLGSSSSRQRHYQSNPDPDPDDNSASSGSTHWGFPAGSRRSSSGRHGSSGSRIASGNINPFNASCSKLLPFEGFSAILV